MNQPQPMEVPPSAGIAHESGHDTNNATAQGTIDSAKYQSEINAAMGLSSFSGPAHLQQNLQTFVDRATTDKAEAMLPKVSIAPAGEGSATDFARGLTQSFAYSLIQSPLEGVSQTIDHSIGHSLGSNLYGKTRDLIIAAPKEAKFGSAEWHGQAIGGALGIMPWFLATRAALRGSAGLCQATRGLLLSEAESALAGKVLSAAGGKMILESGVTAAINTGVFKPINDQEGSYGAAKARHMASDFYTFATLTASTVYLGGRLGGGFKASA